MKAEEKGRVERGEQKRRKANGGEGGKKGGV